MPAIGVDEDIGPLTGEESGALKDKLVLLIVVLILFHIGAFVSQKLHSLATTV
jgi:hypothetical protein